MNSTKFECQLAPVGDPNMKLEWFFNGKPLPYKNRFAPIYDFGYVAMNFSWIYPEDSGEYLCRASNLYGSDQTKAFIETSGKPGIIYESQLPKGMKSIEKIREMEAAWQITPEEEDEKDKIRTAPVFVSKPEAIEVEEGDSSRFCCRVTGYPKPRVIWLINGRTVINGSRYKLTYDGMYHLDIPKTRQYDQNIVEVVAKNSVGEARCETTLTVKPNSNDYRGVLKSSPRRILGTKDYRKPEWVTQMEETQELEKASQQIPRFIREITDAYVQNGEKIVFEVIFAGRPAPDCVWYKNDKLIMNTKNIIIKLFEKEYKSNLTIYHTTSEDEATYVCKITSGIGSAKTQAKLHVITGTSAKPEDGSEFGKEIEIKKKNKKIKSNKIKEMKLMKGSQLDDNQRNIKLQALEETIVKQQFHDIEVTDSLQFEPMESIDVFTAKSYKDIDFSTDVVPSVVESTTTLTTLRETKNLDKQINTEKSIVQSVGLITDSFSVIKDSYRKLSVEKIIDLSAHIDGNIEPKVVNKSSAEICRGFQELKETKSKINVMKIANNVEKDNNEVIQENLRRNKTGKLNDLSEVVVEDILRENSNNLLHAVEKTIRLLDVKEFGKAEVPLRELATIGYLVRQGVSENQINESLYRTNQFPALRTPDSQNALVQLVEREGYGSLITQVLTEETTTDESIVAATVGFRAFMRMVELQHTTVEELILNFAPEDFRPRAWEVAEITEGNFEDFEADMVTTELLTGVFPIKTEEEIETMAIQDIQKFKDA